MPFLWPHSQSGARLGIDKQGKELPPLLGLGWPSLLGTHFSQARYWHIAQRMCSPGTGLREVQWPADQLREHGVRHEQCDEQRLGFPGVQHLHGKLSSLELLR